MSGKRRLPWPRRHRTRGRIRGRQCPLTRLPVLKHLVWMFKNRQTLFLRHKKVTHKVTSRGLGKRRAACRSGRGVVAPQPGHERVTLGRVPSEGRFTVRPAWPSGSLSQRRQSSVTRPRSCARAVSSLRRQALVERAVCVRVRTCVCTCVCLCSGLPVTRSGLAVAGCVPISTPTRPAHSAPSARRHSNVDGHLGHKGLSPACTPTHMYACT